MLQPAFIFANYLATATVVATDLAAGYPATDVLEATQDTGWKPADQTGSKSLTIDLAATYALASVAIVGEYLNGVTLEVRGSTDNFASSNVQLSAPAVIGTASFVTAWRSWVETPFRYLRLTFSGMGPSFMIHHVATGRLELLPFQDDGYDPDTYKTEGSHLVSPSGYLLGSIRQRTMRKLPLKFGQVSDVEFLPFQRWADACIRTPKGFFFVPDTSLDTCHFGWVDPEYVFSAPIKNGLRDVGVIPFQGRLV